MPEQVNLNKNMFSPRDSVKSDYISLNIHDSASFARGTSRSLWRVRMLEWEISRALVRTIGPMCRIFVVASLSLSRLPVSLSAMESIVQVSKEYSILCNYHGSTCNILPFA